jgi:hypothetical protein
MRNTTRKARVSWFSWWAGVSWLGRERRADGSRRDPVWRRLQEPQFCETPLQKARIKVCGIVDRHIGAQSTGRAWLRGECTVPIAAGFCMYNRYVDGLATWAPEDPAVYRESGARLAREGYVNSIKGSAATASQ